MSNLLRNLKLIKRLYVNLKAKFFGLSDHIIDKALSLNISLPLLEFRYKDKTRNYDVQETSPISWSRIFG